MSSAEGSGSGGGGAVVVVRFVPATTSDAFVLSLLLAMISGAGLFGGIFASLLGCFNASEKGAVIGFIIAALFGVIFASKAGPTTEQQSSSSTFSA